MLSTSVAPEYSFRVPTIMYSMSCRGRLSRHRTAPFSVQPGLMSRTTAVARRLTRSTETGASRTVGICSAIAMMIAARAIHGMTDDVSSHSFFVQGPMPRILCSWRRVVSISVMGASSHAMLPIQLVCRSAMPYPFGAASHAESNPRHEAASAQHVCGRG